MELIYEVHSKISKGQKHEWEQSVKKCSHSLLVHPKVFLSARLRLLKSANPSGFSNHFSPPAAFLYDLLQYYIPAVRSTLPKNCLPERSFILSHLLFNYSCEPLNGEKLLLIRKSFRSQYDVLKPKFLSVSCFF